LRPTFTFIPPALPSTAERPPIGGEWIHEIKHDGYRTMVRRDASGVRLLTRNGKDWTGRFPTIVQAAAGLKAGSCLIDGEAVACDGDGLPSFDRLRYRRQNGTVFLYLRSARVSDGQDLRRGPIEVRKRQLAALLCSARCGLQLNEHIAESGDVIFRHACKLGFEGIVSKRSCVRGGAAASGCCAALKTNFFFVERPRLCELNLAAIQMAKFFSEGVLGPCFFLPHIDVTANKLVRDGMQKLLTGFLRGHSVVLAP
jgi:bifunctional non-homologous end joining protein LigD